MARKIGLAVLAALVFIFVAWQAPFWVPDRTMTKAEFERFWTELPPESAKLIEVENRDIAAGADDWTHEYNVCSEVFHHNAIHCAIQAWLRKDRFKGLN
jgi:hypothetical protein